MKFNVFQLFYKMNVLRKHLQDKNIVELEKLVISSEFSEELFFNVLGKCSKFNCNNEDIQMLNLFLKNITNSLNVENYLFERYKNLQFKNDYLRNFLIEKNIISNKRKIYTTIDEYNFHNKFTKINLRYYQYDIGTLIMFDNFLIYDFNGIFNFMIKYYNIIDFLSKEFLRFMFNEKIVIFLLSAYTNTTREFFNECCLKSKHEKSLRKLLNYERRKNSLIFCECIKNLNNAMSRVFNNLHLKIEIIKFL